MFHPLTNKASLGPSHDRGAFTGAGVPGEGGVPGAGQTPCAVPAPGRS